jgi:hypothetical protein
MELERTSEGDINNCALANRVDEHDCQVCTGTCPDRARFGLGGEPNVRPEIQALIERGGVTPAEVKELRCNSWEWEALVPALTDDALAERVQYAADNCSRGKRPFATYEEALAGLYVPELLRRFQGARLAARDYAETVSMVSDALGQEQTHYPKVG